MGTTYQVVDLHSKKVLSTHKTRVVASRKADRLDLQYGAIRYTVRPVWPAEVIQVVIDTTPPAQLSAQASGRWAANDPTVSVERFVDAGFSQAQAEALMATHRQIGGAL